MSFKDRIEASPVVFLLVAVITGFTAGLGTYKAILEIAHLEVITSQELNHLREIAKAPPPSALPPTSSPDAAYSSYTVKLNRTPGASSFGAALRQVGYDVNFVSDPESPEDLKLDANYPVISVGKDVPPKVAVLAIRMTHAHMPWVHYIFLQYQQPSMDRHLLLNAHKDWVTHLGLKELTNEDFALLTDERLPLEEFHKLIHTYQE